MGIKLINRAMDNGQFASFDQCPIDQTLVSENGIRVGAALISVATIGFVVTGWFGIPIALAVDFYLRGFGHAKLSPVRWIASKLAKSGRLVNGAPKRFAATIGFLMSLIISALASFHWLAAAKGVAGILLFCALLEALANVCIGCQIYPIWLRLSRKPQNG